MKKVILIDIDDTIFDFEKCSYEAFKNTLTCLNIEFKKDYFNEFLSIDKSLWKKQKSGLLSVEDVLLKRAKLITNHLNIESSSIIFKENFSKNLANSHIEVDGARNLIFYLSKKYKLCAASNGLYKMQEKRLKLSNLDNHFYRLYISDKISYEKPDSRFFSYIFNDLSLKKNEVIMIGDSINSDIIGAYNFGIESIFFNKKKERNIKNALYSCKVDNLTDIKNIL